MKRWAMTLAVFAGSVLIASPVLAQPATSSFGFNGTVSGFPTGEVRITGGGAYDIDSDFVNSAGGFRCLSEVAQGPLSQASHGDAHCLAGQGVRWDTVRLVTEPETITFKCTGAAAEEAKTATTTDKTAVLEADFYRAGDANDESFTAFMIVSDTDIADDIAGVQNLWIQGVGCGTGIVHFRH